jgi:hypothetical protein
MEAHGNSWLFPYNWKELAVWHLKVALVNFFMLLNWLWLGHMNFLEPITVGKKTCEVLIILSHISLQVLGEGQANLCGVQEIRVAEGWSQSEESQISDGWQNNTCPMLYLKSKYHNHVWVRWQLPECQFFLHNWIKP